MKLLAAIKAKALRQIVPPVGRFARIQPEYDVATLQTVPNHFEWTLGAHISCRFSGPQDAKQQLTKNAMRLIAREVYGEISDDLHELLRLLYEEQYRGDGDPILKSIHNLLNKISGEQ